MSKIRYILTIFACLVCVAAQAQAPANQPDPGCISFDYAQLLSVRQHIRDGDKKYRADYEKVLTAANNRLKKKPATVTDGDKPPTGDFHDFYSIGKFSWPNPNTPDGMPYIRGDGKYNEEAFGDRFDLTRFQQTLDDVNKLSLAWFYSGDERYAAKAKELLNVWFIRPETAMNPHMNCASALPGVHNGMAVGIIFTVVLVDMLDHVKLLQQSDSWDAATDQGLKTWISRYLTWLETSDLGKEEAKATNNHGTWYAVQIAAYNLFIGKKDKLNEVYDWARQHVDRQLLPDGGMPRELRRADAFHYSIYGLRGFVMLARSLELASYDLWSYKTDDGRSLLLAFDFLSPYILGEKPWTWGGKVDVKDRNMREVFEWAGKHYPDPRLQQTVKYLQGRADSIISYQNLRYGEKPAYADTDSSSDRLLDLYLPENPDGAALPVFLFIHGGGFVGGDKHDIADLCRKITRGGFAVVSMNYQLYLHEHTIKGASASANMAKGLPPGGHFQPGLEKAVEVASNDACRAIEWIKSNAEKHHLNSTSIAISGGSAGSMTALYTAYVSRKNSLPIGAVVDLWGGLADTSVIKPGDPPLLTFHGTEDKLIHIDYAYALHDRMKATGNTSSRLQVLEGTGHAAYKLIVSKYTDDIISFLKETERGKTIFNPNAGVKSNNRKM